MEAAEGFVTEVGVFEGMDVGDVDTSSRYEEMKFVGCVGKRTEELSEIQDEGVIWSWGNSVGFLYFPWGLIYNML